MFPQSGESCTPRTPLGVHGDLRVDPESKLLEIGASRHDEGEGRLGEADRVTSRFNFSSSAGRNKVWPHPGWEFQVQAGNVVAGHCEEPFVGARAGDDVGCMAKCNGAELFVDLLTQSWTC